MDDQQQSRSRPTRRQLLWIVGILAFIVGACIFLRFAYVREWKWTGLVKNPDFHKRTLWDWLNLLIVPTVLALGGYLFTRSENQRTRAAADEQRALDRQIADEQRSLDREIADERRQDDMLQAYLDGMSELLTDKERPLHKAELGDYLSTVARARTLTVLPRLNGERKGSVVQFLYESGLMRKDRLVLALSGADLSEANLSEANLSEANLSEANLSEALLSRADLSGADLSGAILSGAILSRANLNTANLSNVRLRGADLSEANLNRAILREAGLREANLSGARLSEANLSWARLGEANLFRADLSRADLSKASLSKANLERARLIGTGLREANLTRTIFSVEQLVGADLREANLRGARGFTNEGINHQAKSLEGATMPNGQKYEDWIKSKGRGEDGENSEPS